ETRRLTPGNWAGQSIQISTQHSAVGHPTSYCHPERSEGPAFCSSNPVNMQCSHHVIHLQQRSRAHPTARAIARRRQRTSRHFATQEAGDRLHRGQEAQIACPFLLGG